ncbi:unnamed protein product [Paramecium primaurelia]|uniref:ADP-ribosylation factor n=1 Tax=Paramecium primaurelia TaxID=5886 RepID=A0A8S1MKM4_PARPR|nr:unnamed protein product [Paramecium primaurelia]
MIGLDNAGKTTILYKLNPKKIVTFIPRIGFNVEKLQLKQCEIFAWDIGGSDPRLQVYCPDDLTYNGIIIVIDSSDKERMICTIEDFHKLLSIEKFKDLPILLFANKKDLAQVNIKEIASEFMLEKLPQNWHIQPCCAPTGEGIQEGLKWMQQQHK